jgi:phospholipid/cholesterol/gamma-HCH transport system substrate-binding protein
MIGAQTRVGALVLGALVILGVTIFLLGRQEHLWERKVDYTLHFARTNGLQRGAPVSLSGLPIGSVESLTFSPEGEPDYIEVWVRIDAKAASRIRTDTTASIRTLGLLGDKYIELLPGTVGTAEALPPGGLIPSVDPVDYEALFGQSGGDIVTNVVEVTTALKDVLQTIQRGEGLLGAMIRNREFGETTLRDLQRTLGNVRGTSQRLDHILSRVDRGEGVIGRLVGDTKESRALAASLDRSIQSLARVTDRLERGRGPAVRLIEDREYGDRLLAKLDRTVSDLGSVADKIERGEGTLGKLVNDPALYDETHALVHDVRTSWLVRFYEALHGLWPFGHGAAAPATPAKAAP